VSLEAEEQSFWPVPMLGKLNEVTSSQFNNLPMTNPVGLFKVGHGPATRKHTILDIEQYCSR
jgi:hypothetical protein